VAILAILVILAFVGIQLAKRTVRQADFGPFAELLKAPVGALLTVPLAERADIEEGVRLFDTYKNAILVVKTAVEWRSRSSMPIVSTELSGLAPEDRIDGWGRPFCLVEVGSRVAAISSGQLSEPSLACDQVSVNLQWVSNLPSGRLYKYPSGVLAFLSDSRPSRG
jgi:hypothetical protein